MQWFCWFEYGLALTLLDTVRMGATLYLETLPGKELATQSLFQNEPADYMFAFLDSRTTNFS